MSAPRKFFTTTPLIGLMATGAYAQVNQLTPYNYDTSNDVSASDMMGMSVYATKRVIDTSNPASDTSNYDDIGTVDDILLSPDGMVKAIVIGVGGFLGKGEHEIAVETSSVHFVPTCENPQEFLLIVNADKTQLKAIPEYEKPAATEPAISMTAAQDMDRVPLKPSAMTSDGYTTAMLGDVTTDDLDGASIYGPNDEDIGHVQGPVLGADGKSVDKVLLDIGGFLGVGEHEVALMPSEVQIMRKDSASDIRVYVNATNGELKALPE